MTPLAISVFITDTGLLPEGAGLELLDEKRRARYERLRSAEAKAQCLAGGLMLRSVLGEGLLGAVTEDGHGKPQLPGGGLHFNLSHSGSAVVLAVAAAPVGIDIEEVRAVRPALIRRTLTAHESGLFTAANAGERAFFALWTAKESIMKADGRGISMDPARIDVLGPDGSILPPESDAAPSAADTAAPACDATVVSADSAVRFAAAGSAADTAAPSSALHYSDIVASPAPRVRLSQEPVHRFYLCAYTLPERPEYVGCIACTVPVTPEFHFLTPRRLLMPRTEGTIE